jgi:hypothetical protein
MPQRAVTEGPGEPAMANDGKRVRRILHLKFTFPGAEPAQILAMVKAASPFFEFFGSRQVTLLQNVDDPARFIQVIDYETEETLEVNRQRIASDPRMQAYLQAWRMALPGGVEIDVFQEMG